MNPTTPLIEKKTVDKLFYIGMLIKAGAAIFEIGTGIFAIFLTTNEVLHVTQLLVEGKLAADPDNFLANYILDLGFSFTPGQTNLFLFLYLAGHGVVNMFLVISLLKKKMWAYPLSLVIFGRSSPMRAGRFTFPIRFSSPPSPLSIWLSSGSFGGNIGICGESVMISFSLSNGVFQANMKSIPVSQDTLRARLMVGLLPLKEAIGVRIPGPQLIFKRKNRVEISRF